MRPLDLLIGLFAVFSCTNCVTLNSYLNENDLKTLRSVFEAALKSNDDLSSISYSSCGLKLLGDKLNDATKICDSSKKLINEQDIESLYYAAALSEAAACKFSLPKSTDTVVSVVNDPKSSAQDLFRAVFVTKKLQLKVDNTKMSTALLAVMKKDDSASNLSFVFNAAALLDEPLPVELFFNKIEDCIAQADEIDKKYLQFEGGLTATAIAVTGVYSLAQRAKKAPSVKPEEAMKLANYLLSRKGAKLVRPAYHLLQAISMFTTNQFHIPIAFTIVGSNAVSSKHPTIKVRVTDMLGKSVGALSVIANSAIHTTTKSPLFTKKQLKPDAENKVYELNFFEAKPSVGFFHVTLTASSATDKRLIGQDGAEISVKSTMEITVENAQMAVVDRDQSMTASNALKLASFSKLSSKLEADVHQKLAIKFSVKNKADNLLTKVHQAFVLFTHIETGREIIFVAEIDPNKAYNFDVDFQKSAKDFDYQSGKYAIKLLLGDANVNNPVEWLMADIGLKFPAHEKPRQSSVEHITYEKKPEIVHMFRQADVRPPQTVSDLFTVIVLLPLVILMIVWWRIGVNLSNFRFDLCTIGFHLGLIGIFGLYFVFWLQLNMFQTLKYLAAIGCFTFLTGNRMLKAMADRRKSKTE